MTSCRPAYTVSVVYGASVRCQVTWFDVPKQDVLTSCRVDQHQDTAFGFLLGYKLSGSHKVGSDLVVLPEMWYAVRLRAD